MRQEILSGICDRGSFERLRDQLRAFPDEPLDSEDFELAVDHFTMCRAAGVHGSNIDFLIGAVARRRALPILTTGAGVPRVAILPITTDSAS